ncbi:flagellar biosynthesis protein FlhA [Helicobacter canadensis]|uniref:Flagellar biosynthesis protein FlhA n=1 Tax=Helicobacter canadensis MIT 98-5491 TaxID=537970 RepID=C5ZVL1_9HELI|nr:flagellar biosynthesis protein FlhA [Helicobacter canadensis]EES88908.1 flagellar biosynthesis protein [Helicobacter canadensis MIT 98-5491]EFR48784.1 flagellar biosynthesis protein FlhA [Helicobacter canadensis MIT 98-5491]STP00178.1 flagellar biosynthesis protein FlhA [Helicobacter canadensis]
MAQAGQKASFFSKISPFLSQLTGSKDLTVVFFIVAILAIIIVPLPSALLDFFLAISIALSALIILIALYVKKPTDFSAFPTLLLIVTLFRLSLNIATTRMILSNGHLGPEAVSDIITAFGQFVVGGNYVIGIILFIILVIINFMVVTNGSTRVSEVKARFTLDAMPGKQMAIDADLNTGLIGQEEAKARRDELAAEADFYGSMDGANKFVKGDAIAGIIITLINIIGGFLIGVFQRDMSVADAASTFTILTIGDGLVSQLPALIVSTATGIIVTRFSKEGENFASGIIDQLINESKTLMIVGCILLMFALVPGLPTLSLGFVGLIFLSLALLLNKQKDGEVWKYVESLFQKVRKKETPSEQTTLPQRQAKRGGQTPQNAQQAAPKPQPQESEEERKKREEAEIDKALKVKILRVGLGYQLIKFADPAQGGELVNKIRAIRKTMATEYGILVPMVHLRDDLNLAPDEYQILLKEIEIGKGKIMVDKYLAIASSGFVGELPDGIPTKEPVFGLDAYWIDEDKKEDAIIEGYTIIDGATVISTHIQELIKQYAEELLTRQEVANLISKLGQDYPILAEEIKGVGIGSIQHILKELLHEQIPIKDMLSIAEAIADGYPAYKADLPTLSEYVRACLKRLITHNFQSDDGILRYFVLSPTMEQFLLEKLPDQQKIGQRLRLSPTESQSLLDAINVAYQKGVSMGAVPTIIGGVPMVLRKPLAIFLEQYGFGRNIVVLSTAEIDYQSKFEILGSIDFPV